MQGEMRFTCFSEIGTAPEAEQLFLLSCLHSEKQECRFLLLQFHAPSPRRCSTLFTAVYKRPLKEEEGLFAFGLRFGFWLWLWFGAFSFWLLAFALEHGAFCFCFYFGLLPWAFALRAFAFCFGAFGCGKLLEGKRLARKELLKKG
jgi:apolipoprotein N-acyltransferase